MSPATVTAGAAATTLTVVGTGFTASTQIQVGSTYENTTLVSSTQVTAVVPAAQLAASGQLSVIAVTGTSSSSSGTAVYLTVNNPAPVITGLTPATLATGSAASTLAVLGTGFVPTTTVQVNGSARTAAFVSSTQMNVSLTAADLSAPGSLSIVATNPGPGGGTSAAASLAINNPVPGPITLAPNVVTTGATTATTVTVNGSNFIAASTVQVGGVSRPTTLVSATQLTLQLTVADQAAAATLSVTVANPSPGGGTSNAATLTVAVPTPTPVLSFLSPAQFIAGSATTTMSLTGSNFTIRCTAQWNGAPLSTLVAVSNNVVQYLLATVPASLITAPGTAAVTVSCPTAPAISNAVTATIVNPPAPTLTTLYPIAGPINTAVTVSLTGTGFTANSTVAFNGVTVPATYVNATTLTVSLPASATTLPGNGSFTVTTPAPGGGTSGALTYTAYIGIVNNSMVYNPVNGLFYVSVPSSVGAPYGNSVVSVDPETGALGTPIPVGSEPDKLAVTADGNYLWVGLDGASAVRKVNLAAGTAGLQFSLAGNAGIYATPGTVEALVALPGATDSVVVATNGSYSTPALAIYDSGVQRGTPVSNVLSYPYALQVDGTKNEIYTGGSTYATYTYSASGLTLKANGSAAATFATYSLPEMQVAGGRTYTDFGGVYDSESGALLGTHYVSGTTVAGGPTVADTTLGKVFVLDATMSYGSYNQIQAFNVTDFNLSSTSAIPVGLVFASSSTGLNYPTTLTRWGTNGLAFRTSAGVFSLRSNLVKDLSNVSADLSVTVAASGATTTGGTTTYTATVNNGGPSGATNVSLTAALPSTGTLTSVTPSAGSCASSGISCDLGSLASGSSATVSFAVLQNTAGSATLTASVSGSETDPSASNNQGAATVTVTGSAYAVVPALSTISPAAILAGSSDTTLTVTGSGFTSGSTVLLGGSALTTSYSGSTRLTATVPAARLASLGWAAVTVSNPAPGGGTSAAVPLSVYSVITLGMNHVVYDPYSRRIMASVGSGSSSITGNSIVAITPETQTIGSAVSIGSQPSNLALTSDGQILYTILAGANSVARYNMLTQAADFTYSVPSPPNAFGSVSLRSIAAQPGTENTIALDLGSYSGNAIYDFNPTTKTAAIRGAVTGPYTGSCLQFVDTADLLAFDIDTSGSTLDRYTVTSAGFTYYSYSQIAESTLLHFGCVKTDAGLAYSVSGGVANPLTNPATQLGEFNLPSGYGYAGETNIAPDTSLQRVFFGVDTTTTFYSSTFNGIEAFDTKTYLPTFTLPLAVASIEGNTSASVFDLIRWGQDGLALLSSGGHLYLVRGAAVVPQLLNTNTAAVLTSSSTTAITHGAGNTLLTLTGSGFVPGVAVTWNGSYRTTTIVDATHVTVAIPASDLASVGSASLVATNPGAPASATLTISIN